ncbi:MAG: trimethylamine methyltransferase family protein [Kiritimatiellae bacterium]|nr:trimethylamine methyltransferase family protein [Verrucomicrobiota bacterium]MCG2681323.1 trimethylamine methyltransferase family protein [Kiritimatiellia bacterium]
MSKQGALKIQVLSSEDIANIHATSIRILGEIGVKIDHEQILKLLKDTNGARVHPDTGTVTFSEELVNKSIQTTTKQHSVYGRDRVQKVTFGGGDIIFKSSDGDQAWIDLERKERRKGTLADVRQSIMIADRLENINLVGPMVLPAEIPVEVVDIHLFAELLTHTTKPVTCWLYNRTSAKYVLEILKLFAGGADELRKFPMVQTCIEPVSPLKMGKEVLDILMLFADMGLPVRIAPMAIGMATAPVTLAGLIAQENAEVLAGVVVTQMLCPGMPVLYDAAQHVMDPRSSVLSYGAPEQALMAVAITQVAKSYGFPVYVDVGYSDSKTPDAQSGFEKGITLLMGILAGADTFGHMGICGPSQGASLEQLVIDDEMIGYIKRILRQFEVNSDTLAFDVTKRAVADSSFITDDHTLQHFKNELWFPSIFNRGNWEEWAKNGGKSILDSAIEKKTRLLNEYQPVPIDNEIQKEIDKILKAATREILG